jgi:hypothetical protein
MAERWIALHCQMRPHQAQQGARSAYIQFVHAVFQTGIDEDHRPVTGRVKNMRRNRPIAGPHRPGYRIVTDGAGLQLAGAKETADFVVEDKARPLRAPGRNYRGQPRYAGSTSASASPLRRRSARLAASTMQRKRQTRVPSSRSSPARPPARTGHSTGSPRPTTLHEILKIANARGRSTLSASASASPVWSPGAAPHVHRASTGASTSDTVALSERHSATVTHPLHLRPRPAGVRGRAGS